MTFVVVAATLKLAIYYGYPTLINKSAGDLDKAAAAFAQYDVIVLGDGLELDARDAADEGLRRERTALPDLIARVKKVRRGVEMFGYVDLGSTQQLAVAEIARRADRWRSDGADGIFFDEAGTDFGVDSARRHAAVAAAHERGLRVFMNAFRPDELFDGDADADARARVGDGDAILLESLVLRNGRPETMDITKQRIAGAMRWKKERRVRVFGVATAGGERLPQSAVAASRAIVEESGLDGFGVGEPGYSAYSVLITRWQPRARRRLRPRLRPRRSARGSGSSCDRHPRNAAA